MGSIQEPRCKYMQRPVGRNIANTCQTEDCAKKNDVKRKNEKMDEKTGKIVEKWMIKLDKENGTKNSADEK